MSAWRREALLRFPERKRFIETADSIYSLLTSLQADLRATYAGTRVEPDLADRVFAFAAWCSEDTRHWDLQNAVAVGFYEHIPDIPEGRRDLARHLPFAQLCDLHDLFYQMLEPAAYHALLREIQAVHGQRLPPRTDAT